jgi:hypothetical protein
MKNPGEKTNVLNRIQRPTASRGYTNGNRQPATASQTTNRVNTAENDDYEPQSPPENGKKRNSTDITFR